METTPCFIGGEPVTGSDVYDNIDPSTGKPLGTVVRAGEDEVHQAVVTASRAWSRWSSSPPVDRARIMSRLAVLIRDHEDELARVESQDTGKPLSQARTDVLVSCRYFEFYAHAIDTFYGLSIPMGDDFHVYTRREPFGVVAHILAWNYPMQLLSRAVAPAIAAGNAVVVKPADETPRTTVRVAALAIEAGLPPGVFNVVTGVGEEAGDALAKHPGVAHIGFVGSTEVGSKIAHNAADRVVPAVLELGGKSAQIVFPDADLGTAANFVTKAILQNAGQTCSAGSRLLVHEDVHDELVSKVRGLFANTSIGPGLADKDLGPLISAQQQRRVEGFVNGAASGQLIAGGNVPTGAGLADGYYFSPTLIDDVDPQSQIAQEEVFGPVLVSNRFSDEEEALALANGTQYALLGSVWTADVRRAHRLAAQIQAGQVYVNTYGAGGGVELPFGGFKKSGYGREKGREALDAYTQTKTVVVRL